MNAKEFKEKFSLIEYVKNNFDYREGSNGIFINCPFHSESTPSCFVSEKRWHCYGACGEGGDCIDFLMKVTNQSFQDVIKNSSILSKYPLVISKKKYLHNKSKPISVSLIKNYTVQLLRQKSKINYLINRGFDLESIKKSRLGYGIPIDVHGWKFRHPRYVIPHFQDGKVVGVKYRIDPKYNKYEQEKYISHPGTTGGIYNIDVLLACNKIIYVGSQFDAAVLWYRYNIPAVAPPSENTYKDSWTPLFIDKEILIWLDNDTTGKVSSLKVYEKIKNVSRKADIFFWDSKYKEKDDFTDFLKIEGIDVVKDIYDKL